MSDYDKVEAILDETAHSVTAAMDAIHGAESRGVSEDATLSLAAVVDRNALKALEASNDIPLNSDSMEHVHDAQVEIDKVRKQAEASASVKGTTTANQDDSTG